MAKAPSLKDVAQQAKVSVTTVSRLLNGSLDLPIETKTRIQDAIRVLNYQPNPHARRLSRGRSDTIGLVVPDIANPFFATLVAAVEEAADERKLALSLYATLNRPGREMAYLEKIERNHVDGLIFVTNHSETRALAAPINRTGKVVLVDEDVPGALVPKLFCDNEQGGYLAGRHLIESGHRKLLFIGGSEAMISSQRRRAGLERAMRESDLDDQALIAENGHYTVEFGREVAQRFLSEGRPATAIFASSDEIAIGLLGVFRDAGLTLPRDVSIVGYDDVGPLHLFAPALTAVRQPVREMGRQALSLLMDTNWQERGLSASETHLPVELVVRESVAPPPEH